MTIRLFDNRSLLPAAWAIPADRDVRVFNPALMADADGWLFAYRVVADPDQRRTIALCRLGRDFSVVAGSITPFSDLVRFAIPDIYPAQATTWFADPRLYRLGGRHFVYWNSGWHEPRNAQFLQEFDPATLQPIGAPRELTLWGARQKLEKNWGLFEQDGVVHAVYSVNPHRILRTSLDGAGPLELTDAAEPIPHAGGYAKVHGGLRGGAPPQRKGDHWYSFCHSIENDPAGYRYVAAAYRFSAVSPHRPTDMPSRPLGIEIPAEGRRKLPKLNTAVGEVIYPAGAAWDGVGWHLSVGIDDERCAIVTLSEAEVVETLAPAEFTRG